MWCKACGEKLGQPEQVLHDPEDLLDIIPGGVKNPDDHHLKATGGAKGPRIQCVKEKSFTSLLEEPPGGGSGSSEPNDDPNPEQNEPKQPSGNVYEITGDESPIDILEEVVTAPAFDVQEGQVQELLSWGDIYDGQIPPQMVQDIMANFSGISKQKAELIRQKYEAKLNKWMQETAGGDQGPPLSGGAVPPSQRSPQPQARSPRGSPRQGPSKAKRDSPSPNPGSKGSPSRDQMKRMMEEDNKSRRDQRVERRQKAIDKAIDNFAEEAARNAAQDAGRFFVESRDVLITLFKQKAKKDPEWFFEKAEKWDMDLFDTLMEESESKSQRESQQPTPDTNVDSALNSVVGEGEPESAPDQQPSRPEPDEPPVEKTEEEIHEVTEEELSKEEQFEEMFEEGEEDEDTETMEPEPEMPNEADEEHEVFEEAFGGRE